MYAYLRTRSMYLQRGTVLHCTRIVRYVHVHTRDRTVPAWPRIVDLVDTTEGLAGFSSRCIRSRSAYLPPPSSLHRSVAASLRHCVTASLRHRIGRLVVVPALALSIYTSTVPCHLGCIQDDERGFLWFMSASKTSLWTGVCLAQACPTPHELPPCPCLSSAHHSPRLIPVSPMPTEIVEAWATSRS